MWFNFPSFWLMGTCPSRRHPRERATPAKLAFGEKMAVVLIQHTLDGLVWRHLTNAPTFSASLLYPHVPEKRPKNAQTPKLCTKMLCSYLYMPGTSLADLFSCFVALVPLVLLIRERFFTAVRKSQQQLIDFHEPKQKNKNASSVQTPYQDPAPLRYPFGKIYIYIQVYIQYKKAQTFFRSFFTAAILILVYCGISLLPKTFLRRYQ